MTTVRRSNFDPIAAALIVVTVQYPASQAVAQGTSPMVAALTPEQKMERRFPQPVDVEEVLQGLRILDDGDVTIARIRKSCAQRPGKFFSSPSGEGFLVLGVGW